MREIIASLQELDIVAEHLQQIVPDNAIIFLTGDLASGKTTLTQSIAKHRGISTGVTSPTFSLQQKYSDTFYHYDLYRLEHEEFMQMGLFEEFDKDGWHMVEWGSDELKVFLSSVGYELFNVGIEAYDTNSRKYTIEEIS